MDCQNFDQHEQIFIICRSKFFTHQMKPSKRKKKFDKKSNECEIVQQNRRSEQWILQGLQQQTMYHGWQINKNMLLDQIEPWNRQNQRNLSMKLEKGKLMENDQKIRHIFLQKIGPKRKQKSLKGNQELIKEIKKVKNDQIKLPLLQISQVQLPSNNDKKHKIPSYEQVINERRLFLRQSLLPDIKKNKKKSKSCINLKGPMQLIEQHRSVKKKSNKIMGVLNFGMMRDNEEVSQRVLNYWHVNHSKRN